MFVEKNVIFMSGSQLKILSELDSNPYPKTSKFLLRLVFLQIFRKIFEEIYHVIFEPFRKNVVQSEK